jgi:succinylglutamate desuccinylase
MQEAAGFSAGRRRVLGRAGGTRPGPTVVLLGGVHGNEPASTRAIPEVLGAIESLPLRGSVIGLAGNLAALERGVRYLDRDLNRGWSGPEVARLISRDRATDSAEDREQRELLECLAPLLAAAREPIVFLDLHSTSGGGPPFTCMADVLRNRQVAFALPIPVILGIEEILDGSLLGYLCDLGHVGVAVEGGQNEAPRTQAHHEAAIWLSLVAAGALAPEDVTDLGARRELLAEAAAGIPPVIEIRHRHVVRDEDGFEMEPGWKSFQPLRRGQVVARDRSGPVAAPEAGLMLMPRYQGQGDDGYFLAGAVSPAWLRLSLLLRAARLDRLVPLLPGVRRHEQLPDHFVVDPRVARYQVVNVFHLFGYRHQRTLGEGRVFSRRRPGFRGVRALPEELRPLLRVG